VGEALQMVGTAGKSADEAIKYLETKAKEAEAKFKKP